MSAQGIQHTLQADFIRDVRAGLGKSGQKELPLSAALELETSLGFGPGDAIPSNPSEQISRKPVGLFPISCRWVSTFQFAG